MSIYFISDLHLSHNNNQAILLFEKFLEKIISKNNILFILGDFFNFYIKENIKDESQQYVLNLLKSATKRDLRIYLMSGNRDFLYNENFSLRTGVKLINDPFFIYINKTKIQLTHGDLLCSKDTSYQIFRLFIRNKVLQKILMFLISDENKIKIAEKIRKKSTEKQKNLTFDIDVDKEGIIKNLHQNSNILIHGHTHKMKVHKENIPRIVLSDWHSKGSFIKLSKIKNSCEIELNSFDIKNTKNIESLNI